MRKETFAVDEQIRRNATSSALNVFECHLPETVDSIRDFIEKHEKEFDNPKEMSADYQLHPHTERLLVDIRSFGFYVKECVRNASAFGCLAWPAFSYGEDGPSAIVERMNAHLDSVCETASDACTVLIKHYQNLHEMFVGVKGTAIETVKKIVAEASKELNYIAVRNARLVLKALANSILELLNFVEKNAASLRKIGLS